MNINDLHEKFSQYGLNAKKWQRKCALMLVEIEKHEVWKHKGFTSIYEYSAKLAGMSKYQVDNALRVVKNIKDKPELMKIAGTKGINSVRPVAVIATKKSANFWAAKAEKMTKNELELYVKEIRKTNLQPQRETKMKNISIQLEKHLVEKMEKYSQGDLNQLVEKMLQLYEKELKQELEQEKPEIKDNASSYIPKKIKKYILKRCHGKCEYPNCNKNYQEFHHTERFGSVKRHDPDKIVALCKTHHSLAHKGLVENEDLNTKYWKIKEYKDLTNLNRYIDDKVQFYRRY